MTKLENGQIHNHGSVMQDTHFRKTKKGWEYRPNQIWCIALKRWFSV